MEHTDRKYNSPFPALLPPPRSRNTNSVCVLWIQGPDWKWGNQDGGAGNIGRVFSVEGGVVKVSNKFIAV